MIEQLRPVTQDNLHLLLPCKVAWIADYVMTFRGLTREEAMLLIYQSRMMADLAREDTKLWHYGPVALYEMLCDEKGWPRPDGHVYSEAGIRD